MSDLFTKASSIKTTTKLWIVGVALLITVNIPFDDNHYQPSPAATIASHPADVVPMTSSSIAEPTARSVDVSKTPIQSDTQQTLFSSVAGDYGGMVYNQTAAKSADFAITLQDSDGALSGSMTVKPPLYGSGQLEGSWSGANITFIVTSPTGKIAFMGTRIKQDITGTYTVTPPSGKIEQGTFRLTRKPHIQQVRVGDSKVVSSDARVALPNNSTPESISNSVKVSAAAATSTAPVPIERSDPKNYSNCLYGLPDCDRGVLTDSELAAVAESARKRNLSNCMYGLPNCEHGLLTDTEESAVAESARKRNLSNCMHGLPNCNRNQLTTEELIQVQAGGRQHQQ